MAVGERPVDPHRSPARARGRGRPVVLAPHREGQLAEASGVYAELTAAADKGERDRALELFAKLDG